MLSLELAGARDGGDGVPRSMASLVGVARLSDTDACLISSFMGLGHHHFAIMEQST